jgi:hypothetical protein
VIVSNVIEGSPAWFAGLRKLDIIRVVNRNLLKSPDDIKKYLGETVTDSTVALTITKRVGNKWKSKVIRVKPFKESKFYKIVIGRNVRNPSMLQNVYSDTSIRADNGFSLYYLTNGDKPELFLRITHTGRNSLYVNKYVIRTDSNSYTLKPGNINHDSGFFMNAPLNTDWCDYKIKESDHKMIRDIADSDHVSILHSGISTSVRANIPVRDRNRVGVVFDAYLFGHKE